MHTFSLRHIALRRTALAAALALAPAAWAGTVTVAITGQLAPGTGPGISFTSLSSPQLNAAGRVAYVGRLSVLSGTDQGIWLDDKLVARTGMAAPGAGTKVSFASLGAGLGAIVNDAGQVAFVGSLVGTGVTPANDDGIWRDGTLVARTGDAAPGAPGGAVFSLLGSTSVRMDSAGRVVYFSFLQGGGTGLWRDGTPIAVAGNAAPGAGPGVTFASVNQLPSLNARGDLLYGARLAGPNVTGGNDQGLWRNDVLIAREGDAAPGVGSGATFAGDFTGRLNALGEAAYFTRISGAGVTSSNDQGLWRGSSLVARTGNTAPGTALGVTFKSLRLSHLNSAGQLTYVAELSGAGVDARNDVGIWRDTVLIARNGDAVLGASSGITLFATTGNLAPQANDTGALAFASELAGTGVNAGNDRALFLGDGVDLLVAARTGDALAGSTIANLAVSNGSFNDKAQLAYSATLTDGRSGIFVYTPTLHWRRSTSGSWEDTANWTLGVNPAGVHDVTIDAATSLRITGPTGAVTLKSLQVGTGAGLVTLQMAGGSIDAADPVLIGPRGVLSGTGSFSRLVINQGTVQADQLVLTASLSNAGLVRGVAGGPRNGAGLDADLLNQAGGRVLVQPGETLQLRGASHRNLGVFEINQGRLEVAGTLLNGSGGVIDLNRATALAEGAWTNAAGARLLLGDARLTVSKGLTNAGQVLVTSGDSDVFGAVVNQKAGQVLLSGQGTTTFYDTVELQSGSELRTSAGATAVFFGAVAQRSGALLTGTGHKYFEGAFSVGNSPGLGEDAGSVSFGLGSTYLAEIGGTALGSGYDHYRVAGTLTLGGTLQLVSFAGFVAQDGQEFDLFDAGTLHGQFSGIDSSGLLLAAGTTLDASRLYTDGVIRVTAVPEPDSWALMAAGLLGLGLRASQRRRPIATPSA